MRDYLLLAVFCCLSIMGNAQSPVPVAGTAPMNTYSFRLRPGEDLRNVLETIVQQQRVGAGFMLTCVGSLTNVTLRLANQDVPSTWQGHFEIVSLVGTLSANGSHLHLSVADSTGRTLGGHLLEGCTIYTTAEVVIGVIPDLIYEREVDPTYGYKELIIKKRKKK